MLDINDSKSLAQGCRCYEQLKVVEAKKEFTS